MMLFNLIRSSSSYMILFNISRERVFSLSIILQRNFARTFLTIEQPFHRNLLMS